MVTPAAGPASAVSPDSAAGPASDIGPASAVSPDSDISPDSAVSAANALAPARLFDLTGKVALVTGGSRGIGRAIVRAYAAAGADVVISSRRLESCELLAREIEETTGRSALAQACHAGRWTELPGLVDAAYERFGHVDVLVNNAGLSPRYESLIDVSEELWDKVYMIQA